MKLPPRFAADVAVAGAWAAALGGIPSTVWALATGGDPLEAARAAGAMLVSPAGGEGRLLTAAVLVHLAVNFFWAAPMVALLPSRHFLAASIAAALAIGVLDLRVIARFFFPEVHALAFWPQMADHLAWGATLGAVHARRLAPRGG
jgi:hypothetical protein